MSDFPRVFVARKRPCFNGFFGRLWVFGFSFHVGPGLYCNGRKWIVFRWREEDYA